MHVGSFQMAHKNDLLQFQPYKDSEHTHVLQISQSGSNPSMLIQLQPHTPYQYLGIHLTMNGDWKKELKILQTCNQNYMQVLTKCAHLERSKHHIPSVLPTSGNLSPTCSSHSYWQAWWSPTKHNHCIPHQDGLPMHLSKCSSLCTKSRRRCGTITPQCRTGNAESSTNSQPPTCTHHHWHHILHPNQPLPTTNQVLPTGTRKHHTHSMSQVYGMDNLQAFLLQINGQVIIHEPWTPKPRWDNDKSIMEALLQAQLPLSNHETKIINNVHIHLQANMLSDISDH